MNAAALRQTLQHQRSDFRPSLLGVILNVVLVVALLGFFGVETTTFAALLAGVGIAIGAAWSGLLANVAAGIFLVLLRPFKVEDFVSAGGVTGAIESIGLFGTTINTPDNVQTIVGSNKILCDNIQNFSTDAFRLNEKLCQPYVGRGVHAQIWQDCAFAEGIFLSRPERYRRISDRVRFWNRDQDQQMVRLAKHLFRHLRNQSTAGKKRNDVIFTTGLNLAFAH